MSLGHVQSLPKRNLLRWALARKRIASFEDSWCSCSGGFHLGKWNMFFMQQCQLPKPPSAKNLPPPHSCRRGGPAHLGPHTGPFRSLSPLPFPAPRCMPQKPLTASQRSLSRKHRVPKSQQTVSPRRLWQRAQAGVYPAISGIGSGRRAWRPLPALPGHTARRRSCPP